MACAGEASVAPPQDELAALCEAARAEEVDMVDVRCVTAVRHETYEPSDDSFALVDALAAAAATTWLNRPPVLCVEVGVGSGYVSASLLTLARQAAEARRQQQQRRQTDGSGKAPEAAPTTPALIAVDISPTAVRDAAATFTATGVGAAPTGLVLADLAGPLLHRLAGAVDVLAFNPPYVPTPPEEVAAGGIAAAWAGGHRGRVVIDRALPALAALLAPGGGEAFIVTVAENDPGEVLAAMARLGAPGDVVLERGADEERLVVLRCRRG